MMRTGDLLEVPSSLGLLNPSGGGGATAALSVPPLDLSAYSQLVQHMASLYRCDPAAVAASLATISSSASHLPLAMTAPHALSTAAFASAAMSATQRPTTQSSSGGASVLPPVTIIDVTVTQEQQKTNNLHMSRNIEIQSFMNRTSEMVDHNKNSVRSLQSSYNGDKVKKNKQNNNVSKTYTIPQDTDGALDLSTQGLRSIYSSYRRITLDKLKPKVVEDLWVENDSQLSWTNSKVAAYNPAQKLFMCVDCECVGFLSRVAEHWLGAHANLRVFRCPRCPYTSAWSRCVKMHITRQHNEQSADTTMWKENATLIEVTRLMQELRTKVETRIDSSSTLTDKRFYCPHCPYATDRRDLYTRHENIHKDDKPFHCYLCFKQFNRADHVKKHFVRMHPDTPYDIAKIRKQPGTRGRASPAVPVVHEAIAPPHCPPSISVSASLVASPTLPVPSPSTTENNRQRSLSPLPLTIQNLRVHNMAMNSLHPPPSPSPEITVDVVTPDVVQPLPFQSTALIPDVLTPTMQPHSITITKCSPSSPSSPQPLMSIPKTISMTLHNQSPEPKSPETSANFVGETTEVARNGKKRADRAFRCPYCQWSGSDNWCLKRHMNTHIKPFACSMCEYKAARAERLSTHVLKVHNKRICNKCNFMADTQEKLLEHTREEHHNNPYSRRHTCGICGITMESQSSLQSHLQKIHAPQSNPPQTSSTSPQSPAPVLPVQSQLLQDEAQDLTVTAIGKSCEEHPLICPVEECPSKFSDSNTLAIHLQKMHGGRGVSRCPHCSYCLTKDELAKDHWLTHHQDVCSACVHVFTSVYGPQLWKKVHVKQVCSESPLDVIVTGLSRKRSAPSSVNDSPSSESDPCESISAESDHHDSDTERQCKRSRKQSCPKKVIAVAEDADEEDIDDDDDDEDDSSVNQTRKSLDPKRRKTRRCLRCAHRPVFASYARLRIHRRNRHRSSRTTVVSMSAPTVRKAFLNSKALET